MKRHHSLKILALAAMLATTQGLTAQHLFEGVATFSSAATMSNGTTPSATLSTYYYRGQDLYVDMPQNKLRTLYLAKEKKQYTINAMMGKPILMSHDIDPDTMGVPLFDIADEPEVVDGHTCLKVQYENETEAAAISSTVWLDTTYHILFHYGLNEEVPWGLPVREEMTMTMKGSQPMKIVNRLVSVTAGKVDDTFFAIPDEQGMVLLSMGADGQPMFSGDTTGMMQAPHSALIEEVDSAGFRSVIAHGRTVCMMTATWCGPCRLLYPRLENVSKQVGKDYRFIKVDIDKCRTIAKEYNTLTIPVVILFENGKELRRITSAAYSEEDILKFVTE
ncbi:MAG: thioredoxin family protein [Bacteroidales bacterium]|nr:thioredoxin family protein [Bacteroidales bacterium]